MTHDDFFQAVKRGEIARVYLMEGEEEFIKERALAALRKQVVPEGMELFDETLLQNPSAGDVMAAAETLPMMAAARLVIVRESALLTAGKAASEAADSEKLAAYIERAPETTCLVFYCRGLADGRKKLTQALRKKAVAVRFDPLQDAMLSKWMQSQFRARGKTIAPGTAARLAFTAGHELLTLSQEIEKLFAYLGERTEVTQDDIEAVVTPSLECTVFQLVDALVDGKEARAFELLAAMLENGEARIGILAMMARQYRNLLHLRLLQLAGVPEGEMGKRLGVQPFVLRRLTSQARGASPEDLRARLDLCVDTDFAIKSGKMREDAALERAMLRLCSQQGS